MITVTIYKKKSNYVGFNVEGHAYYDEYGKDIVCAAISILTQTCVNSLKEILKLDFDFEENQENARIKLMLKDLNLEKLEKASLLIESMKLGMSGVSSMYPENIKVISKEV